jgi:hypothetical protein
VNIIGFLKPSSMMLGMKYKKSLGFVFAAILSISLIVHPAFGAGKGNRKPIRRIDLKQNRQAQRKKNIITATTWTASAIFVVTIFLSTRKSLKSTRTSKRISRRKRLYRQITKWHAKGLSMDEIRERLAKDGYDRMHVDKALGAYNNIINSPAHRFDNVTALFMENRFFRRLRRELRRRVLLGKIGKLGRNKQSLEDIQKILIRQGWQERHVLDAIYRYKTKNR